MSKCNFDPLTPEETAEVVTEGLSMLGLEEKLTCIIESLGDDELAELGVRIEATLYDDASDAPEDGAGEVASKPTS